MQKEIFKNIPNYEGIYQVSSFGNVKSLKFKKEKILKPSLTGEGKYLKVVLSKEKIKKNMKIHQLVAITFLNHKQCGMKKVVDHIDNNPLNNKLDNLQIVTNRENSSRCKNNVGVKYYDKIKKWSARIRIKNHQVFIGNFNTQEEASKYYNKAVDKVIFFNGNTDHFRKDILKLNKETTSQTRGVYFDKNAKKWKCSVFENKKRKYLGKYDTETEAINKIINYKANQQ